MTSKTAWEKWKGSIIRATVTGLVISPFYVAYLFFVLTFFIKTEPSKIPLLNEIFWIFTVIIHWLCLLLLFQERAREKEGGTWHTVSPEEKKFRIIYSIVILIASILSIWILILASFILIQFIFLLEAL